MKTVNTRTNKVIQDIPYIPVIMHNHRNTEFLQTFHDIAERLHEK